MRTRLFTQVTENERIGHILSFLRGLWLHVCKTSFPALAPRNSISDSSLVDQLYQNSRTHCVWHVCVLVPEASLKAADLSDEETTLDTSFQFSNGTQHST